MKSGVSRRHQVTYLNSILHVPYYTIIPFSTKAKYAAMPYGSGLVLTIVSAAVSCLGEIPPNCVLSNAAALRNSLMVPVPIYSSPRRIKA